MTEREPVHSPATHADPDLDSRGPSNHEPRISESELSSLEPAGVWRHFDALRRVPRPSRQNGAVVEHVRTWARNHGFEVVGDEYGNQVVRVPATAGREEAPTVVLQAHLDMVCEKNEGVDFDFERQPIRPRLLEIARPLETESAEQSEAASPALWVGAVGTTLGADNGIGVAMAMAAALDPQLEHGPLELLFTLDEEVGLLGARALDGSLVRGRRMINLDAEEDDGAYIGCAGAAGVRARLEPTRRRPEPAERPYELRVDGLRGGHSGVDIHRGRGNAPVLLAGLLVDAVDRGLGLGLARVEGGDKANALPRQARALLWLTDADAERWRALLADRVPRLEEQLGRTDPGLEVMLAAVEGEALDPADEASAVRWARWLDALPHGPVAMVPDLPGLVETSVNLASVESSADGLWCQVLLSLRSSSNPALDALGRSIASTCYLAGAAVERIEGYPGWQPNPSSALVARTAQVYGRLFREPLGLRAVHAGVECGVIAQRVGGLDAVSIGPEIVGAHSPHERVSVASVAKVYQWLSALLADLAGVADPAPSRHGRKP